MRTLFESGFFSNAPVHTALIVGAMAAVVSAIVGVLVVVRSQSFAGHALTDVATTGGSAAAYYNFNALVGFLSAGALGAGAMEIAGMRRRRSRDVATGVVLGAATGLSALFLYLDATSNASTGVTQQVLFGSIFTVSSSTVPASIALSAGSLLVLGVIYRPLLLGSLSPELAAARGVGVRGVGVLFLVSLSASVGLSALAIGSLLSTALLIGPAATSIRVTSSLRSAMIVASVLGVLSTWLGILFAYDSYDWISSGNSLPVSFFIVAIIILAYALSSVPFVKHFARRKPF